MPSEDKPDLRTPDGTDLRVAVSALIKALRRGQELEGYYWAKQIEAGGFWRYLWRRLRIFASEDVGLGDNQASNARCADALMLGCAGFHQ